MRPLLSLGPVLLLRGLAVDRRRPDLAGLAAERRPERFVWRVLPHAARSFAASIVVLPREQARAAAVAYLYCRMLDTYGTCSPIRRSARSSCGASRGGSRPIRCRRRRRSTPDSPATTATASTCS